jgi:hypothetical protein
MYLGTFLEPEIDLPRIRELLDGLGHPGRLDSIRQWDAKTQARLFEAAKGFKAVGLDDFVPPGTASLVEIIHHGYNSLPTFNHFQKRFCLPPEGEREGKWGPELWGYNEQRWLGVTGPGYYVAHAWEEAEGEVAIDYRAVPPKKPASWPEILPNEAKLGRLVYAGMVDVMRGISNHVSIGRAMKGGKWMDAWFVLCREDRKD